MIKKETSAKMYSGVHEKHGVAVNLAIKAFILGVQECHGEFSSTGHKLLFSCYKLAYRRFGRVAIWTDHDGSVFADATNTLMNAMGVPLHFSIGRAGKRARPVLVAKNTATGQMIRRFRPRVLFRANELPPIGEPEMAPREDGFTFIDDILETTNYPAFLLSKSQSEPDEANHNDTDSAAIDSNEATATGAARTIAVSPAAISLGYILDDYSNEHFEEVFGLEPNGTDSGGQ